MARKATVWLFCWGAIAVFALPYGTAVAQTLEQLRAKVDGMQGSSGTTDLPRPEGERSTRSGADREKAAGERALRGLDNHITDKTLRRIERQTDR